MLLFPSFITHTVRRVSPRKLFFLSLHNCPCLLQHGDQCSEERNSLRFKLRFPLAAPPLPARPQPPLQTSASSPGSVSSLDEAEARGDAAQGAVVPGDQGGLVQVGHGDVVPEEEAGGVHVGPGGTIQVGPGAAVHVGQGAPPPAAHGAPPPAAHGAPPPAGRSHPPPERVNLGAARVRQLRAQFDVPETPTYETRKAQRRQSDEDADRQAGPGRQGEAGPGRQGEAGPGRQGEVVRGRQGEADPGRQGEVGPGWQGEAGPGRQGEVGPGRQGEPGPGRQGEAGPGRQGEAGPGRHAAEQALRRRSDQGPGTQAEARPARHGPEAEPVTYVNLPAAGKARSKSESGAGGRVQASGAARQDSRQVCVQEGLRKW